MNLMEKLINMPNYNDMGQNDISPSIFKKALKHSLGRIWRGKRRETFPGDILGRRMACCKLFHLFKKGKGHVSKLSDYCN